MHCSYVLITPARDEEANIGRTIESVLSQTRRPLAWIIIDDCSMDSTSRIVEQYARRNSFIALMRRTGATKRDFRHKAKAFSEAYLQLAGLPYDLIGNLDADVSFDPDYFERLLAQLGSNPRLGVVGGVVYERIDNAFHAQRISSNSVAGAVQLFRRRCYEDIGGYLPVRHGGTDAVAEISARMHGWEVQNFPELRVLHHRRVGMGEGSVVRTRFKEGVQCYAVGYHPLFQVARCVYRTLERPYLVGSVAQLAGYISGRFTSAQTGVPESVKKFARREQFRRLVAVLTGRRRVRQG